MTRSLRATFLPGVLTLLYVLAADAQDDGYPEGSLAPNIDLGLQAVALAVPGKYRDRVPENLTVNLPPGFSAGVFAAGLNKPRLMAVSPEGVLHVCNMGAREILALPDGNGDGGVDLSDVLFFLEVLFGTHPTPAQGTDCFPVPGCPELCS